MSSPFGRVLVANRGEIAVRICRALREMGIESVAVHSDPDSDAPHVQAASRSYSLGGDTPLQSYLSAERILEAAEATGAQAIHPGYGFLSENPEFAEAVEARDLTFIGPDPRAMAIMASKRTAREAARSANVPVIPGFDGDVGDDEILLKEADRIGFPLMVKAASGGGGKGMRLVDQPDQLSRALAAARREAMSSFADDQLVLEKLILPARHIEVQVFGDLHGNVVSLNERECSIQRRHQKIIEESPSPAVDTDLRRRMSETAVALTESIGYRSAGTLEFLLDDQGEFYFLEMNTRLQVEHPVTEMVTGLDLVQLQLQVAAGASLEDLLDGRDLRPRGHSIEARIYAESPADGYLPAAGRLDLVVEPSGPGVRVDSGVHSGCEVSVHYDPLMAKLIVHAPDRASACRRMSGALADSVYLGIPTNVDLLRRVIEDPDFEAGVLRTDFLERKPELAEDPESPPDLAYVAAAVSQTMMKPAAAAGGEMSIRAPGPWQTLGSLRLWEKP